MTWTPGVSQPPSRRIVLLTKVKRTTMRLGATTMRLGATTMAFFRKGEELEATDFENLPYNDPGAGSAEAGFQQLRQSPAEAHAVAGRVPGRPCDLLQRAWVASGVQPDSSRCRVLQAKASEEIVRLQGLRGRQARGSVVAPRNDARAPRRAIFTA